VPSGPCLRVSAPSRFEIIDGSSQVLLRTVNFSHLYLGFPAVNNTDMAAVQQKFEVSTTLASFQDVM
jgi:hypothetical protein